MDIVGIAPQQWKSSSIGVLKNNEDAIRNAEIQYTDLQRKNPLPHFRDYVIELSNTLADQHARNAKNVVNILIKKHLEINEHLKCLNRQKESLITTADELRRDIQLNKDTFTKRSARPSLEKIQLDGADDLLIGEKQHLQSLKSIIDEKLEQTSIFMQDLNRSRDGIKKLINERSRVTDLICNTTRPSLPTASLTRGQCIKENGCRPMSADPLGFFTPQCEMVLKDADSLLSRSRLLQADVCDTLAAVKKMQKQAFDAVNSGMLKKVSETMAFNQRLNLAAADNRKTRNKMQRMHNFSEKSLAYNQGPVLYGDLFSREKLDRPIIRVFQRHTGNQVPEAQEIIKVHNFHKNAVDASRQRIELLKTSERQLHDDIRAKRTAMSVDLAALRNRRQKLDGRW